MNKIATIISARPSYSRVKSFLLELNKSEHFDCIIALTQSAVLRNFGDLPNLLRRDGFENITTFQNSLAENTPLSMALNTALSLQDVAKWLSDVEPDACVVIADRYETLSISIAAAFQNIPLIHIQGGEVTGNIDEKVRHANTKLADVHFVSNKSAARRLLQMGESPERIFETGCPSLDIIDIAKLLRPDVNTLVSKYGGVGGLPDLRDRYGVVLLHPETETYGCARDQVKMVYEATKAKFENIVWFWPNVDAGSDSVSKYLREVVDESGSIRFFRSFDPIDYLALIFHAQVLIGNSSSGIREAGYLGVPTVNVGNRQDKRDRSRNVIDTPFDVKSIENAIESQINVSKFEPSYLYGNGNAGKQMVAVLESMNWPLESAKRFNDV